MSWSDGHSVSHELLCSRYHGVLEKFIQFCSTPDVPPLIKRGEVPHLVLVGYRKKEDALNCLQNVEEVTLAPGSRS